MWVSGRDRRAESRCEIATITPSTPLFAGVVPTSTTPAGGGDEITNTNGNVIIRVRNDNASSCNVTLTVNASYATRPADGVYPLLTNSNNVVAVASGATKIIGPVPTSFNNASGRIPILCSVTSSVALECYVPQ